MINRILEFAVRQRMLVFLGADILATFGVMARQRIPIDAFPDVTTVQVQVLADAGGMSPLEVEKLITRPIEIEMGGPPRMTEVGSVSKIGLSKSCSRRCKRITQTPTSSTTVPSNTSYRGWVW